MGLVSREIYNDKNGSGKVWMQAGELEALH